MRQRLFGGLMVAVVGMVVGEAAGQPLRGTVQQRSFLGPVTGRMVQFNIYLPEGYAGGTQRYPVIYHLHGLGGSQGGPQNTTVPASFEAAEDAGIIGPVIIVFPSSYTDGWWADSFDGAKPAETDVALQLVPYVDANFRTIATRGARVVQGFSMGGFGTMKFYSKFPELFSICVEYDGALVTWQVMLNSHAGLAASIFGNSEAYFNQYSPWHWTTVNAGMLGQVDAARMVLGALLGGNRNFRDHLIGLDIPVDYVETACGHDLGCMLNAQGLASAAFIAERLVLPCAKGDANCDGVNDFFDIDPFITALFDVPGYLATYCDGTLCAADINCSGVVDFFDIDPFLSCLFGDCPACP